jgi:thioredoxin 1
MADIVHANNKEEFTKEVLDFDGIVLVDFYADRCGPCKMLTPIMEELHNDYGDNEKVKIVKVDVDANQDVAGEYGVMSIPTVYVFKNGESVFQQTGVSPKGVYENKINEALEKQS